MDQLVIALISAAIGGVIVYLIMQNNTCTKVVTGFTAETLDEINSRISLFCESWNSYPTTKDKEDELEFLINFLNAWRLIACDRRHDIKILLKNPKKNTNIDYLRSAEVYNTAIIEVCEKALSIFQAPEIMIQHDLDNQYDEFAAFITAKKKERKM